MYPSHDCLALQKRSGNEISLLCTSMRLSNIPQQKAVVLAAINHLALCLSDPAAVVHQCSGITLLIIQHQI